MYFFFFYKPKDDRCFHAAMTNQTNVKKSRNGGRCSHKCRLNFKTSLTGQRSSTSSQLGVQTPKHLKAIEVSSSSSCRVWERLKRLITATLWWGMWLYEVVEAHSVASGLLCLFCQTTAQAYDNDLINGHKYHLLLVTSMVLSRSNRYFIKKLIIMSVIEKICSFSSPALIRSYQVNISFRCLVN